MENMERTTVEPDPAFCWVGQLVFIITLLSSR